MQAYVVHLQIEVARLPGNNPSKMEVREETSYSNQQEGWSKKNEKKNLIYMLFNYRHLQLECR
jgi:hypothetical protein